MDGWFAIYVPFNSISLISGRCEDDNDRLCAMEHGCGWKDFRFQQVSKPGPPDQQASA